MAKGMFRTVVFFTFVCNFFVNCMQVCNNFESYINPSRQYCWDNPDGERNVSEILRHWPDVTVEDHHIYTEDGYELLLIRAYSSKSKGPVVLGPGMTSFIWVNRGKKSLAHLLVTGGHDVWIVNFRGSYYSRGHKSLDSSKDEAYWRFSFDEMGKYDLDCILNYVMNETNQKSVYIGHSVGTTASFIYAASKPKAASNSLKGIISLGPTAYLNGIKSYARYVLPVVEYLKPMLLQRYHGQLPMNVRPFNCSSLLEMYLLEIGKVQLYGDDFAQIDPETLPLVATQNTPASIGVDLLIHYSQLIRSKKFQAYDFGKDKNDEKYGQQTPPAYNISQISVPVAFFVGKNDWVSTIENSKLFYNQLDESMRYLFNIVSCDKWNHNDFVEAKDVVKLLYDSVTSAVTSMEDLS